jgi:protein-L-isoaspartate O-methyltransferase
MTHDKLTLEFYAREAAAYGARSDGIGVSKALGAFLALLPKGGKVLDLGCGTGRDTQAILEAGFDVTAIDGSAEMAAEARRSRTSTTCPRSALVKDERRTSTSSTRSSAMSSRAWRWSATPAMAEIPAEWLKLLTEKFLTDEEKARSRRWAAGTS